jgi:hypothetical protein
MSQNTMNGGMGEWFLLAVVFALGLLAIILRVFLR